MTAAFSSPKSMKTFRLSLPLFFVTILVTAPGLLVQVSAQPAADDSAVTVRTGTTTAGVQADAATVDLNRADAVNVRLQTSSVTDSIESTSYALRDQAIALAQRGADEGFSITASIKAGVRVLGDTARGDVEKILNRADQARARLVGAIATARDSSEARWNEYREMLSDRYEGYAEVLEEARKAAVDGGVRFEDQTPQAADAPDGARE